MTIFYCSEFKKDYNWSDKHEYWRHLWFVALVIPQLVEGDGLEAHDAMVMLLYWRSLWTRGGEGLPTRDFIKHVFFCFIFMNY